MGKVWRDIPLDDYEAHMASPEVGQAQMLADVLGDVIGEHAPRSLALLGCAGGNGLDAVPAATVGRVVAIDINPSFVEATRQRYQGRFRRLDALVGDLETDEFAFDPVDLVFAGLVFEYVNVAGVLTRVQDLLRRDGVLVSVLQLPSPDTATVTPTPYSSLIPIASILHLVPPDRFLTIARDIGYREAGGRVVTASGGKRFHVQDLLRGGC